jgi:psp operon transcriptional activator
LHDLEKELVEAALERSRFNQKVAANMLGLSYHQFRGRLRKLNVSGSPPPQ